MRERILVMRALLLAVAALLALVARGAVVPANCSGTTLTDAYKTAQGTLTRTDTYTWSVSKLLLTPNVTADNGQCTTLVHRAEATRSLLSVSYTYGVTGTIGVTNGGAVATQSLSITDTIQRNCGGGTGYVYYAGPFTIDISSNPILDPGETGVYSYNIALPAPTGACAYRNSVNITILNHSGAKPGCPQCPGTSPCPFGPNPKADFAFPIASEPTAVVEEHKTASLLDVANANTGYTCSMTPPGAIELIPCSTPGCVDPCTYSPGGDFVSCDFFKEVCNVAAECDTYSDFCDYIQLMTINEPTGVAPLTVSSNTVCAGVYSGTCTTGCSLTIGYWKTHAGFNGNNEDRVTEYLPIVLGSTIPKGINVTSAAQSTAILAFLGDASNGLNKLAAQLLAVRYNQLANGATISAIASNVTLADSFLGTYGVSRTAWNALSNSLKNSVRNTASTLDAFNNGLLGPGHCV